MRFLMCEPCHIAVLESCAYGNTHMDPGNPPDVQKALREWGTLLAKYEHCGVPIEFIQPAYGLPDMAFSANCGYTFTRNGEKSIILSNFRPERRRGEKKRYRKYFEEKRYRIFDLPDDIFFEGAGDAIPFDDSILVGYGFRTSKEALPHIQRITGKTIIPLELKHPGNGKKIFYHLDTAILVCNRHDTVAIAYPGAFTPASYERLKSEIKKRGHLVEASYEDAAGLALNAVVIHRNDMKNPENVLRAGVRGVVITADTATEDLINKITACEYAVCTTTLSEFIKSGGGAFCLTKILED